MFGKSNSFDPARDIPSLEGKVIIITGGNAGLGKQTALYLAKHNPTEIWIAARNATTGNTAIKEIQVIAPRTQVEFLELDLGSFESVKRAAKKLLHSISRIDILILNGGIIGGPASVTPEGYELRIGVNHMGHALLVKLLLPLLLKTATGPSKPRVVVLSSEGHKYSVKSGIDFQSLKSKAEDISVVTKYSQSKMANLLYARRLAEKYPQLETVSIHPGTVKTDLFEPTGGGVLLHVLQKIVVPLFGLSIEDGAKNSVWAATTSTVTNGEYYSPIGVGGTSNALSQDKELVRKFGEWTEKELEPHFL